MQRAHLEDRETRQQRNQPVAKKEFKQTLGYTCAQTQCTAFGPPGFLVPCAAMAPVIWTVRSECPGKVIPGWEILRITL